MKNKYIKLGESERKKACRLIKNPPVQAGGGATSYFPRWPWTSLFTLQACRLHYRSLVRLLLLDSHDQRPRYIFAGIFYSYPCPHHLIHSSIENSLSHINTLGVSTLQDACC